MELFCLALDLDLLLLCISLPFPLFRVVAGNLKALFPVSQPFRVNNKLRSAFMIEKALRISLKLSIGYTAMVLLCSPTNAKFEWPAKCIGTQCF